VNIVVEMVVVFVLRKVVNLEFFVNAVDSLVVAKEKVKMLEKYASIHLGVIIIKNLIMKKKEKGESLW
jgi:hypothetical protein